MKVIKDLRAQQGLSQRHLARLVGCSGPFISDIENGHARPSIRTLRKLAMVLGVSETTLLAADDEHPESASY